MSFVVKSAIIPYKYNKANGENCIVKENSRKAESTDSALTEGIAARRIWDSNAEQEVFECLQKFLNRECFCVFPHMPISEVIKNFRRYDNFKETYIKFCELVGDTDQQEKHFELSHFDFTIYNKSNYLPVLIIEADGSQHRTNPSVIFFDKFKDYIATQYEIPLIRLELYNRDMDIEEELEKKLKGKNLNDPYNYPVYCWKCGKKLLYRAKGAYGSFYFCRSCNKAKTEKSVTLSNTKEKCPPLFVWDKE